MNGDYCGWNLSIRYNDKKEVVESMEGEYQDGKLNGVFLKTKNNKQMFEFYCEGKKFRRAVYSDQEMKYIWTQNSLI